MLRAAQDQLAGGAIDTQAGAGDVSVTSTVMNGPDGSALNRIRQILQALYRIDPIAYPANQVFPVRRTRDDFSRNTDRYINTGI